ncbi:MAG: FkbM family methyltransferase [Parvibaculum sp.]|uniref:FkbM family methyltransferase n=1 Tax=Parvibaculum sp. TaxID=2024848 RepID=UPI0025EE0741|nr:FkbM family methyltransferase [Parvibaculum sp.]MCE9649647.1 FkbM family methyltransferase [Parvibaculum sp.]
MTVLTSTADPAMPPRTLLIDMTPFGGATATGELKRAYFEQFEKHRLLHLYAAPRGRLGLAPGGDIAAAEAIELHGEDAQLAELVAAFDPEIILYRPVADRPDLHKISMKLIAALRRPWIIWMMDDWPERLRAQDNARFEVMDRDLRKLLHGAADRFAISEAMVEAFGSRYGVEFKVFRNGAAPGDWVELKKDAGRGKPLRVRYAGSLAPDTTRDSVYEIAQAIEKLAGRHRLTFEIRTQSTWHRAEKDRYRKLKHVVFETSDLDEQAYRRWLANADVLVVAYNFDAETIRYLQYSFANKTPEYLASGVPVLAYGPRDIATVRFLADNSAAAVVDSRDADKLTATIERLITSKPYRDELALSARAVAFSVLGIEAQRRGFMRALSKAAEKGGPVPDINEFEILPEGATLTLAYPREAQAHIDETKLVSILLDDREHGEPVMIDVGAHFGGSAAHFVKKGWKIFCFEPDAANRMKLTERFGDKRNIIIDPRAVSEKAEIGKAFFSSKQSTGISGLSAFHDTHVLSDSVDVTTIGEVIEQHGIDRIDFLKIDVEGFDFSVLKGVPWNSIRPSAIECEFEDAKTIPLGHTWRDIAEFLVDKGYTVYVSEWHPIVRYGIRHDWFGLKRYPCDLASPDAWGNLLAFQQDPATEAIKSALTLCVSQKSSAVAERENRVTQEAASATNTTSTASPTMNVRTLNSPANFWRRLVGMDRARLANAIRVRSTVLFHAGRLGVWALRAARRRRAMSLSLLATVVLFTILPVFPPLWSYRAFFWLLAAALALIGAGLATMSALQVAISRFLEMQAANIRAIKIAAEQGNARRSIVLEARVASLEAKDRHPIDDLAKQIGDLTQQIDDLTKRVADISGADGTREAEMGKELASISAKVNQDALFQRFNRVLTHRQMETLRTVWSQRLGVATTKPAIAYMAHRIRVNEQNAIGRLATQIEDAVLRTFVASAVQTRKLEVLEIGTLFGIGLAMIYEHNRNLYGAVHVTAIDPLDGYYDKDAPDILLNIPITKATFWRNMDMARVPHEDVTLIAGLSTDEKTISVARGKKYDVLIIDGDHTYAGVKADFDIYHGMMNNGGYVIFDDYGSTDWPDVKAFVDKEVMGREDMEFVGAEWRTAVFRVIAPEQHKGSAETTASSH